MATIADGRIVAVDAYINKAGGFAQPILEHLREVVHAGAPGVVEAMKWSMPFFVYQGVILGNMAAFKAHCSFGLWGPESWGRCVRRAWRRVETWGRLGRSPR